MRRAHTKSWLVALVVLSLTARAAFAAVAVSGPSLFVVANCGAGAITLRFISDAEPLAVRTNNPTPAAGDAAVAWTFDWDKPQATDAAIKEYRSAGMLRGCPEPGNYTVPLTISVAGPPVATATLTISIVRRTDPILDAPSAVVFPVAIWPWDLLRGESLQIAPGVPIREASAHSPIERLAATAPQLKDAAGQLTGISLSPNPPPITLAPGEGGAIPLTLSWPPHPGSYTAQIVLHAPPLPDKSVDVTVKVRFDSWLLLAITSLGVALGWFVNVKLATRAALDAARIAALRTSAAIGDRVKVQSDPAVQQRLLGVAQSLEAALGGLDTVEAIKAKTDAAIALCDKIEKQAIDDSTQFATDLKKARDKLMPGGNPPDDMIASALASVLQQLDTIARSAENGDVARAMQRLSSLNRSLDRDVMGTLHSWLAEISRALDEFGPWPDAAQEPEKTSLALRDIAASAFARQDAAAAVVDCNSLARTLRAWVVARAPGAIDAILRASADALRSAQPDKAKTLETIASNAWRAGGSDDPLSVLRALTVARRQAVAQFDAWRSNALVASALNKGDFVAAAHVVAPPPAQEASRVASAPPPLPIDPPATAIPAGVLPTVPARLVLPAQFQVGAVVLARIDWGSAAPRAQAAWSCEPNDLAEITNQTANDAQVRAKGAGFVKVTADLGAGEALSASAFAGETITAPLFQRLSKDATCVARWTGVATGLVTVFAGFVVFESNWVGTLSDVFAAFSWGFFGQFGLDRISKLAQPAVTKTI